MTIAFNSPGETVSGAERALQIIESMPGHAWSADAAGRFTYVSPNTLAFLGNAREELNTPDGEDEFGWRRVVHPDDYDRIAAKWRHCLATGDHYDTEHRLRRADGVYRWFRNSGRPSRDSQGRITQWYGTTMDIDDQKRAEAALRDRERELSLLVDMVPSHLWRLTPEGEPTFFNKRMVDFLGLDVADTDRPGLSRLDAIMETVHPDDAAKFRDALHRCLLTGESFAMRYRLRRADGVYRWMSSRAEPLRDQDGRIVQWYGLSRDIDDQMHAEEALAAAKRDLQLTIDTIPVYVATYRPDGTRDYVNRIWQDYVGLTTEQATGQSAQTFPHFHPEDVECNDKAWRASLVSGKPMSIEVRVRRADGQYRWHASRRVPLRDEKGNVVRWYSVGIDIDDQKRAEAALRDREREFSQLVDMVPSHLWRLTPEGEPTFFNKRMIDFLGLDVADTDRPGISRLDAIMETVHPDDAAKVRDALHRCLVTGESFAMRYRLRRADGVYRWMSSRAEPLRDPDGRIVQWYGLCHDIDDQVHAEEALAEAKRDLQQMIDAVPAQIWCSNPNGDPTYINKRQHEFIGSQLEDFDSPGEPRRVTAIRNLVHPEDFVAVRDRLAHCRQTGESFVMKYRMRRADGVYRWVEGRSEPFRDENGSIVQWYGVLLDIDDQMRAQEDLQKSERRYRDLFHYMPIGLTQVDASKLVPLFKELRARGVTDLETYIDEHPEFLPRALEVLEVEEVNQHTIKMFGARNAEEMLGPITRYWQPGISTIRRSIEARYRGEEVFQEETKVARMDGGVVDVLFTTARPGAVADKSLVGFIDITERKKAEEALRDREREFSQLVEMVPSLIWRLSPEGEPTFLSKRLRNFLGAAIADAEKPGIGRLAAIIEGAIHPDDADSLKEALNHSFVTGERFSRRYRMRRADGVYRWVEGIAEPLRDERGRIVQWYGLSRDIDDQIAALSRLQQMQADFAHMNRVSTMGELAASLSHEILHPIATARNNARAGMRFLEMSPPNLDEAMEALGCVVRDADRAKDIVARMRNQIRKAPPRKELFEVNEAVNEVIAMVRSVIAKNRIGVSTRLAEGLAPVQGDRVQVQQVLVNLILNAVEAMASVEAAGRELQVSTQQSDEGVLVAVRDGGPGINPEHLERVFEAFYTTKISGVGMGLSICRSIVAAHGGRLWAEANQDRGAVFQFTLPAEQGES
jgi:hypothetical protein